MKTPQSDPELYAACVAIISSGLHEVLVANPGAKERALAADAAATLIVLLKREVTP